MTPEQCLEHYWGYDSFRPLQREIIQSVLDGHDTIALLPTGGGKSITFQVPALLLPGITLVITPLISLMKDQVDNLRAHDIVATCLYSGLNRSQQQLACDRGRLGKAKLVYMSPERASRESFAAELRQWPVSMIVVDEAHCISQWGYDFRPNYLKLDRLRQLFPDAPVMALTASATPEVVSDIADKLQMRQPQTFARSFARDNISYLVRRTDDKQHEMLRILQRTQGSAIVYVRSRARTRELAEALQKHGISADFYHAGLDPDQKSERQDQWKSGQTRVIVATNAFGMGIDKPDVRTVIHHDLPSSLEEYYQEAGRAGRDGQPSFAVMLAAQTDKAVLARRLSDAFPPPDEIVHVYDRLGVWLNVSVDGGFNEVYDCTFDNFCRANNFQPARARSALGILSLAGYIEFVDELATQARVMIKIDREEFYSLDLDPVTDRVFQTLLRTYTGLFADYTPISENLLARRSELSTEQVYQALLLLSRMQVLSYVPKRVEPYVYYRQRRLLPRYVTLPLDVYDHRKKRAAERLDALRRYAFDDTDCRVQRMLHYFGDTKATACGKCDYCRAHSGRKPAPLTADMILDDLRAVAAALCTHSIDAVMFTERYNARRTEAAELLRQLADRGTVTIDGTMITLKI